MLARISSMTAVALALSVGACATPMMAAEDGASTAMSDTSHIAAAVADPRRPAEQAEDDANRKPAAMLEFAGVEPGDKVGELIPGGGYFSRIFAAAVGEDGHVYTFTSARGAESAAALAGEYDNVTYVEGSIAEVNAPEPLDLIWTSQNYHDVPADVRAELNASIYDALAPGGRYVVLDHSGAEGAGAAAAELHRMDKSIVMEEVQAAGLDYVGESDALSNPDDPRDVMVFDPSVRGQTDQFVLLFEKPDM